MGDKDRPLVLIVDDDPDIAGWIERKLNEADMSTSIAENGVEALAWLHDHDADVVQTNVMMPRIDGLELTRRIRAKDGPPVIICTAKGMERDRQLGLELGAVDWIYKGDPDAMLEVAERVKAALPDAE